MSLENQDGAVDKLMEEGNNKQPAETVAVGNGAGDKYDELNPMELSDDIDKAYAGMGKEELMKYANSPFWVRLRWLLFVVFWLSWFAMMFGALFIIFMTPKCFVAKLEWYKKSPVFVIDTASLVNNNELDKKIEYMQKLGVQNVVLSSVFHADGEEVINFTSVNVFLGNKTFFTDLVTKLKSKNMKVLLKFVPIHSSTSNIMFSRSALNEPEFKNYYIWNPGYSVGEKHFPPNNWLNVTGQSGWKWHDSRKAFYFHQFSENDPDFNFRNQAVVNYFKEVFKFWLDTGVDGFYLDQIQYLYKDEHFKNDTIISTSAEANKYNFYSHTVTSNLPETYSLLSAWGKFIDSYSGILIVSDLLDIKDVTNVNIVHSPVKLASNFTGEDLLNAILIRKTTLQWPSWEWVCTDKPNSWKNETLDAFNILGSLLPGTPVINSDPAIFKNNTIPNITLTESTLKELRSMVEVESVSFGTKLLNNDTVFAFDKTLSSSETVLFAWNLSKNNTVLNLSEYGQVPTEVNLLLCTQSACSILPSLKSKIESHKLNLAAESAVVVTF